MVVSGHPYYLEKRGSTVSLISNERGKAKNGRTYDMSLNITVSCFSWGLIMEFCRYSKHFIYIPDVRITVRIRNCRDMKVTESPWNDLLYAKAHSQY